MLVQKLIDNQTLNFDEKVVVYRMAFNCEIMFDYLTATGKQVPESIGKKMAEIDLTISKVKSESFKFKNVTPEPNKKGRKLKKKERRHENFLLQYEIGEALRADINDLVEILEKLTALCHPCTPCTLQNTLLTHKVFIFFGQKTTGFLLYLGIISLLSFLGFATASIWASFSNWYGVPTQILYVCAAALGASFYSLNSAKKFVVTRTFDNWYIQHYYYRLLLGVIAGSLLANIIDPASFIQTNADKNNVMGVVKMSGALIALLGGFSSDFVNKLFNRLLNVFQSFIYGDTEEIIESKKQTMEAEMEKKSKKTIIKKAEEINLVIEKSELKPEDKMYKNIKGIIGKMLDEA